MKGLCPYDLEILVPDEEGTWTCSECKRRFDWKEGVGHVLHKERPTLAEQAAEIVTGLPEEPAIESGWKPEETGGVAQQLFVPPMTGRYEAKGIVSKAEWRDGKFGRELALTIRALRKPLNTGWRVWGRAPHEFIAMALHNMPDDLASDTETAEKYVVGYVQGARVRLLADFKQEDERFAFFNHAKMEVIQ